MPYKYDWYIKGQIISAEIWGDQTLEELEVSNLDMIKHLEDSDRPLVHVIIKDENLESVPVSLIKMRQTLTYGVHPKLGWVVMIGSKKNTMTDFMVVMLAKITRARFIRVRTFEDAMEHLSKVDSSINWDAMPRDEGSV